MDNQTQFNYYLHTKRLAEATRISVIKQVNSFLLWLEGESIPDVTEVSYNDVMAFVKYCGKAGNSQKTVAIKLGFLNHYFMWLVKTGEMTENPTSNIKIKGIRRKHLQHVLKKEQLNDVYQSYPAEGVAGIRNKVMLGLIIYQALRVEELTSLRIKDVLIKEGKVQVGRTRKADGRALTIEAHQMVELLEYLSGARKQLLTHTSKHTDHLLISSGTGSHLLNTLQYILAQVKAERPEIKDWKQIRASVISHWITIYGLRKAQYLAGHRHITSTEEYKQQDLDELQGDIDRFHPLQ